MSLYKWLPERSDATIISKFLRRFSRRRKRFMFLIFVKRVFVFHLIFFGRLLYRFRCRWLCLEAKKTEKLEIFSYMTN